MSDATRRTIRTAFAALLAVAAAVPVLLEQTGLKADQWPWLATIVAVAATVTRVINTPVVEDLLRQLAPWLAATPATAPAGPIVGGADGAPLSDDQVAS